MDFMDIVRFITNFACFFGGLFSCVVGAYMVIFRRKELKDIGIWLIIIGVTLICGFILTVIAIVSIGASSDLMHEMSDLIGKL